MLVTGYGDANCPYPALLQGFINHLKGSASKALFVVGGKYVKFAMFLASTDDGGLHWLNQSTYVKTLMRMTKIKTIIINALLTVLSYPSL
jgi:hypothetical protein